LEADLQLDDLGYSATALPKINPHLPSPATVQTLRRRWQAG